MKRLLLGILFMGISVTASEIKPFGQFNFGDSITPTVKNICAMKGIETILINGSQEYKIDEFCQSPIKHIKKVLSNSIRFSVDNKYFKNISMYGTSLTIKPINIKDVPFSLRLRMDLYGDKSIIGAYLTNKKDTLKVNKLFVPLVIKEVELKPLEKDLLKMNKHIIYKIIKNKYSDLFAKLEPVK